MGHVHGASRCPQAFGAYLAILLYLTLMFYTRPFLHDEDDLLELVLQICLFMVVLAGQMTSSQTGGVAPIERRHRRAITILAPVEGYIVGHEYWHP